MTTNWFLTPSEDRPARNWTDNDLYTIRTILQRIRDNNRRAKGSIASYEQGILDGRVEAYEDVLRVIGYYDEDGNVIGEPVA